MSVYESAVKRPIMTALCFIAVVIFGIFSFTKLPIDLLPDIETNTLMIITSYSGASAEDIETNVTRPLENTLNSVEHLKHISSKSRENISLITLEFEYGYDIDDLTNDVRDKLNMVTSALPDDVNNPIIFKFSADMIPIMMLSVKAEESMPALYKILDDNLVNPLARIDGVGSVSISGAPKREINVYMDPNKMNEYNITIETVSARIGAENRNIPGGSFDVGNNTYPLRVKGEFITPAEMENIIVGTDGRGASVYLKDIAEVVDGTEERAQKAYTDGQQGAMVIIQKQSGGNSVNIAKAVREMLPELQKRMPSDIEIGIIQDTSENINMTIKALGETIAYALIFVMLVVFIFLGRWRATVIIGITIPFSLIASLIYLFVSDGSLNIISLSCLSIAIGNVVDDAIVVLENITTHIERGSSPKSAAVHGTNEVAVSVIASTLTMLAVFFPLTMISGMAGVLFKQLGWMMCIIMIVSTIAALTLIPMMCSKMLKLQKKQSKIFKVLYTPIGKGLDKLDNWYAKRINWAVRHRWTVLIICFGLFFASLLTFPSIKSEFFPTQDSGNVSATLELRIGTRVEAAEEVATDLTNKWKERYGKDMKVCNFRVGQADDENAYAAISDNGSHIISFNMRFVPVTERSTSLSVICDQMRADVRMYSKHEIVRSNISQGGGGGGMGGESKASFEIYGEDFEKADALAQELKSRIEKNTNIISQVRISRSAYQPEIEVKFDREKLAMNGLNLSTAATMLRNCFNGAMATYFREDGDEYKVKVRYAPEFRNDISTIKKIVLTTPTGAKIRIEDVAKVVESETPPTIERKDRSRIVTVDAVMAAGAALSDGVNFAMSEIDQMDIPSEFHIQVAGSYEDQQESNADMGVLAILIIILVFIVMAAQFESLTYPFIIMFSVPFAMSGVLLAMYITGTTMNIMSILGAIMLIGIVVKNGIVLIDYTMLLRGRGLGIIPATVRAARSRLRPILMTTLTTILGMVPLAVSQGVGAEMWRPLGIAVIGGLVVSTIMTLLYTPVMYCVFGKNGIKRRRKKLRKQRELDKYWKEHKEEEMLIHSKK
ncbi:MAG: efflux RND transporter permease subunit [Bacteroidaceae bacterium]|nr:efflux RND transporter permease subunit [Bacteroidaceae bacterium]